jgi:hypothetical protein
VGYSNVVPLIYVKPGKGLTVLNNIIASKNRFDTVPFDIDGLVWDCINPQVETIGRVVPVPLTVVSLIPEVRLNQAADVGTLIPINATGGITPYIYSISPALPIGLVFNTATGEISNAASVASPVTKYTVTVIDTGRERASATFTLTVIAAPQNTTFVNSSFENSPLVQSGTTYTTDGWIIYAKRVRLNGLDNVLGYPTPNDTLLPAKANKKADDAPLNSQSYTVKIVNDAPKSAGKKSLQLINTGNIESYGIMHGPYAVSADSVTLVAGDAIEFWWQAKGGGDAYDVYAYLLNTSTGATIELLNDSGISSSSVVPWTKVVKTIAAGQAGSYRFVFLSGSWDASGGKATGGSLFIDNIGIVKVPIPTTTTTSAPQIVTTPKPTVIFNTRVVNKSKYLAFPRTGISEYGK